MPKTELSPSLLSAILARFDLRLRAFSRVEKGTINSNYRVDTDGGAVFLRVNEGKREPDVRYEGALLWHLGARRFPTPQPLRTSRGEAYVVAEEGARRHLVTVFPFVPGYEIEGAGIATRHCAAVGEALARLHLHAADFPQRRDGIYTFERVAARVSTFRSAPLPEDVLPILDEEMAFLRASRRRDLPAGTIHGDLFPDNLLWLPERRSRRGSARNGAPREPGDEFIAAVLDFEQASRGAFAYDLAVTLLAWCSDGNRLDESRAWALVSGYRRLRALSLEEGLALWVEARAAAFRFTVTRITDVYLPSLLPGAPPPREGKDYRDYLARLLWLRAAGPEMAAALVDERPPLRAV